MIRKSLLLGSAAIILGVSGQTMAASITPGGKLDVSIGGFARFLAGIGDVKEKSGTNGGAYDFRNDTEVHVKASINDESSGVEVGALIEFEADTNRTGNTDETWVFMKGAFGEFRFGDDDAASDDMKVGGFSVAVGTGGIDGSIIDTGSVVGLSNSDDATKIAYYSPSFGGINFGLSYTPHAGSGGDSFPGSTNDGGVDDWVEGGVAYAGELGGLGIKAAVVGGLGHINGGGGDDEVRSIFGGVQTDLMGFKLAGGLGTEEVGEAERDWFNVGIAAELGPLGLSVTYGQAKVDPGNSKPKNLALGAEMGIVPGVVVSAEVSFFDEDRGGGRDDGVLSVIRLAVSF